jgi:hypothetical protein
VTVPVIFPDTIKKSDSKEHFLLLCSRVNKILMNSSDPQQFAGLILEWLVELSHKPLAYLSGQIGCCLCFAYVKPTVDIGAGTH